MDDVGKGSTEEELLAHKASWKPDQQWQFRRRNELTWRIYPKGCQPGWFYDTEYRIKPHHVSETRQAEEAR